MSLQSEYQAMNSGFGSCGVFFGSCDVFAFLAGVSGRSWSKKYPDSLPGVITSSSESYSAVDVLAAEEERLLSKNLGLLAVVDERNCSFCNSG